MVDRNLQAWRCKALVTKIWDLYIISSWLLNVCVKKMLITDLALGTVGLFAARGQRRVAISPFISAVFGSEHAVLVVGRTARCNNGDIGYALFA